MPEEFDQFAEDYSEMVRDPLKDGFVSNYQFFHLRKWVLLEKFFARQGWKTDDFSWLDVGCGQGDLLRLGMSRFRRVSGCDPSGEMLKKSEGIEVRQQPSSTENLTAFSVFAVDATFPARRRDHARLREWHRPAGSICP